MSTAEITADEMYESLTGFEEIAIEKAFGEPIEDLASTRVTSFGRALVFVHHTREGMNAKDAKEAAMRLRIRDVEAFWAEGEDEPMPEEPLTDEGKGGAGGE